MQSRDCKVILTNPCGKTGEAVAESLRKRGIEVEIIERPNAKKREAFYVDTLREAVSSIKPEMIIPVFFPEVLASHRNEFPGVIIPLDDASKIRMLDDKLLACELAASLDIPQPKRYSSPKEVDMFPAVLKRPFGQGGDSVYFPRNAKALDYLVRTSGRYLLTQFIEGDNICIDALRWDGFFHAEAYRVIVPKGKGVSRLRISVDAPKAVEYVERMLNAVDYKGVCGFDFRKNPDGEFFFLECNPRFSGGIESAIASGFDIPYLYYCLASGKEVKESDIHFKPGVLTGKIVVAPDSFKGSLSASKVADALASGIKDRLPGMTVVKLPMADGGEGTAVTLMEAMGGNKVRAMVSDPLGRPVEAEYGIMDDLAVIEVASACGLTLLSKQERNPLKTTSRGVGELILDAIGRGCKRIIVGLGGSATNDGGRGMIDVPGLLEAARTVHFRVACDVDNPLVGENGASRVYGPQKGATPEDVELLEQKMCEWAEEMERISGTDVRNMPGAGAAGGLGAAFAAFLGAELEPGADIVMDALDFGHIVSDAALVITGEGRSDAQTLRGKVAGAVLRRASEYGVPVALLSGDIDFCPELESAGFYTMTKATPDGMPLDVAMRKDVAAANVMEAAARLADYFSWETAKV